MKRSNRLIILIGVFLAIVAFVGVLVLSRPGGGSANATSSPKATAEPTATVVIAKTQILLGQKITVDMLDTKTMTISQRDALGPDTFGSVQDVAGKFAGGTIEAGQVILAERDFLPFGTIAKGQDIAPAINQGFRAMSLEVDQVNGVGTLLVPGDHVDVMVSVIAPGIGFDLTMPKTGGAGSSPAAVKIAGQEDPTVKLVVQNRRVLAVLLPAAEDTGTGNNTGGSGGSPTPKPKKTTDTITESSQHMIVILEVKPDEAEVIRWAQRAEKKDPQNYISLGVTLRSDKDNDAANVSTTGVTFKVLVDKWNVLPVDLRGYLPTDIAKLVQF